MALWKDPQTGKYRVQFQHLGRRYSKTGFTTQKAAARWQADRLRELEQESKTPAIKANSPASASSQPFTLGKLMLEYLQMAERKLAPVTLRYRKTVFRRFLAHLGDVPAATITHDRW